MFAYLRYVLDGVCFGWALDNMEFLFVAEEDNWVCLRHPEYWFSAETAQIAINNKVLREAGITL